MWVTSLCAAPQTIEGAALQEPISINLDFADAEYLLVKASQSHADYSLELIENETKTLIRKVNFPSDKALDEILLVHISDCTNCLVKLLPQQKIDTNSPYRLTTESIKITDSNLINDLQKITSAGEYRLKADQTSDNQRTTFLQQSNIQLESILETNNPSWLNHALTLLAENFQYLDNPEQQQDVLSKLLDQSKDVDSLAKAYALLEYAAYEKDEIKVRQIYDDIIRIGTEFNDLRIATLAKNYKAVNLVQNAYYDEALALLNEAKAFFSETQRWRDLIYPAHNLSWAAQRAGLLPESLAYATQQMQLADAYDDKESKVLALYNFALTYGDIGERYIAEDFLDRAISLHANLDSYSTLSLSTGAYFLLEKTQMSLKYGAFESALDYADQAKKEFDKLGYPGRSTDVNTIEAEIAAALKDFELAEAKFKQSIKYDQENNRTHLEGVGFLRLAELMLDKNDFIEASAYQAKAFKLLSQTQEYGYLARAFSQAVELLYHLGANNDSQQLLKQTSAFIEKHSLEQDEILLLYRKALVSDSLDDDTNAIQYLTQARTSIEKTLPKIKHRDLRRTYLALQKKLFEFNIKLTVKAQPNQLQEALALVETYKARTLAESVNMMRNSDKHFDTELTKQRKLVLDQIQKNALLLHAKNQSELVDKSLLRDTRSLSQRLEKLEFEISKNQNNPIELAKPITAQQIPNAQANQLIAYYFIGNNNSWLWVITDQQIFVHDLPAEQEIKTMVSAALAQIDTAPSARQNSTAWEQTSAINALSDVLLSPLFEHLETTTVDLITIIPDGPLYGLPFAPLALPESLLPIISDYAISYAPSLMINQTLNQRFRKNISNNNASLLAVADPVKQKNSNIQFADLPFSKQEALTIQSLVGESTTLLLSENATKAKLLNELTKPYSILHFATHGLLNRHEPSLSGLALTASETDDDSLWLSPEISNAQLSADLVILSACDSSIGKSVAGEGLFSLSRAFIEGGANQVIGTLWSVQDQSTSALFEHFYSQLFDQNLTVAKALQQAQLAIYSDKNNDWSDPYYWAGFQLLGGGADQTYATSR